MTQSFDDWAKVNGFQNKLQRDIYDIEYVDLNTQYALIGYEAGAQSKQAEIDGYKEVAESIEDAYLREKAKVDELRKRIDSLMDELKKANDTIRCKSNYSMKWGNNQ